VLRNAALTGGEILLDVGASDGLVAFGALEIVGEGGRVHFSDIVCPVDLLLMRLLVCLRIALSCSYSSLRIRHSLPYPVNRLRLQKLHHDNSDVRAHGGLPFLDDKTPNGGKRRYHPGDDSRDV
jgi:hypothetical protein